METITKQYRIYLISQSEEFENSLFIALRGTDIHIAGNQSDIPMALWEIKTLMPEIVIMDFDNNGTDAFDIYASVMRDISPDIKFIIATDASNYEKFESAYTAGISYCIMQPCNMELLTEKIISIIRHIEHSKKEKHLSQTDENDTEQKVVDVLFRIGVPEHCSGYALLKTAIVLVIEDNSLIDNMMSGLYPALAKKHSSTVSRVERNIRNIIQIIWNRGNLDYLADIFANTIHSRKGTPSNSHFIATVADLIIVNKKEKQSK